MSLLLLEGIASVDFGAPVGAGCGLTTIVDEYGFRITNLWSDLNQDGVAIEAHQFGKVLTHQHPSPRAEETESSTDMTVTLADFSDPDDWSIQLSSRVLSGGATGIPAYTWDIYGTVDQSDGVQALLLRSKLTVAPWAAPTTVLRGFSYELKINPIDGDSSLCRAVIPGFDSAVYGWGDARFSGSGDDWTWPGRSWAGDLNGLPYDEPKDELRSVNAATTADVYLFKKSGSNPLTYPGICFRFANATGAARIVRMRRDSLGAMFLTFTFTCRDNSVGVDNSSDTDFVDSLQIRPMVGEDYDAIRWCGEQEEAEAWPWTANGPITTNTELSEVARKLLVLGYADAYAHPNISIYYPTFTRLSKLFTMQPDEMAVQIYDLYRYENVLSPNQLPYQAGSADTVASIFNYGIRTVLYELTAQPMSTDGSTGIDSGSVIWDSLTRTRDGYTIPGYGDLGGLPISGSDIIEAGSQVYYQIGNYDISAYSDYMDDLIAETASEIGIQYSGFYHDTAGGEGAHASDSSSLTPDQRGIGSTAFFPARRAAHERQRQQMAAAGLPDPVLFGEFINPFSTVGSFDLAYVNPIYPPAAIFYGNSCLSSSIKYGRHIRIGSYTVWSQGPGPYWSSFFSHGWATSSELHHYTMLRWFMAGMVMPMQRIWLTPTDTGGFVLRPGEPGYDDYVAEKPFYDFVQDLWLRNRTLVQALQTRSVRLRELSSSLTRRALNFEIDGISPITPAGKVGSGVWHVTEEREVVVVYANWSRLDGNPETVTVSDAMPPDLYPELGSDDRDVWAWDWRSGEVRLMARHYAGTTFTINLTLEPGFVGSVIFAPANQLSQLVQYPTTALGLWGTRLTTRQHNYVGRGGPSSPSGAFATLTSSLLAAAGYGAGGPSLNFNIATNSQYYLIL